MKSWPWEKIKIIYNATIISLAIISLVLTLLNFADVISLVNEPYQAIDFIIWIAFIFDYVSGLLISKNKWTFFKTHLFDLLAIIPANLFSTFKLFKAAKLTKFIRLFKFIGVFGKLKTRLTKFLKTNGFIYLLGVCLIILVISAVIYSFSEKISFDNALWWSITTSTTVGYGDISPHTKIGKIIAIILMLVGVGFVGMLTSTLTAFFSGEQHSSSADEIRKYKSLLDDGIITKAEFEAKKKQLLNL
ncbi:ion channel [Fructilactobacillus myrtifloralis]|uniref:Ion channel n=1 Tax=Fructilactobacillus myrtifloralis TaxID=2940301 RepID=A0ABY5BNF8_9LACO|nr:ion channel [Fructilactobacillus myrtifloralis]USS85214.1 ion channel [Fructilactobacillus myrtifloralis]